MAIFIYTAETSRPSLHSIRSLFQCFWFFLRAKHQGKKRGLKWLNSWCLTMIWKFGILGCVYSVNSGIGKHQASNHRLVIGCEGFNQGINKWLAEKTFHFKFLSTFLVANLSGKVPSKIPVSTNNAALTNRFAFSCSVSCQWKTGCRAYQNPLDSPSGSLHKKRCGPLPLWVERLQWHHRPFLQISPFVDLLDSLHWHQPQIAWKSASNVKRFLRFLRHWRQ